MIYTLTLNPALDYIVSAKDITLGLINRSESESILPGGKGINVSLMLKNLGTKSTAIGFCAGYTGDMLKNMLDSYEICNDFIRLKSGMTRINVKIKSQKETDINGNGPCIDYGGVELLYKKLSNLQDGDVLVMAGSIPNSMPAFAYADIMSHLQDKNIRFVVDTTGEALISTLKYKPFLIKPNNFELGEIFGKTLETQNEIVEAAKKLYDMGAQNVLVSLGADGAILVCKDGVHSSDAPKGEVVNTTGSGDSMVAGFLSGYEKTGDYFYALTLGVCAGSATAFTEKIATEAQVTTVMKDFVNEI